MCVLRYSTCCCFFVDLGFPYLYWMVQLLENTYALYPCRVHTLKTEILQICNGLLVILKFLNVLMQVNPHKARNVFRSLFPVVPLIRQRN